jgi:hypothetical protein
MKKFVFTIICFLSLTTAQTQNLRINEFDLVGRMTPSYNNLRVNEKGFDATLIGTGGNSIVVNGKEMWLESLNIGQQRISKAVVDGKIYMVWYGPNNGTEPFAYLAICNSKATDLISHFATWADWMGAAGSIYRCNNR